MRTGHSCAAVSHQSKPTIRAFRRTGPKPIGVASGEGEGGGRTISDPKPICHLLSDKWVWGRGGQDMRSPNIHFAETHLILTRLRARDFLLHRKNEA